MILGVVTGLLFTAFAGLMVLAIFAIFADYDGLKPIGEGLCLLASAVALGSGLGALSGYRDSR